MTHLHLHARDEDDPAATLRIEPLFRGEGTIPRRRIAEHRLSPDVAHRSSTTS